MFRIAIVAVVLFGGLVACSDGGGTGPAPGGINGPARVEPNPGANNPADGADE